MGGTQSILWTQTCMGTKWTASVRLEWECIKSEGDNRLLPICTTL